MKIRTKENLIDELSREHVWRLREISELKFLVHDPRLTRPTRDAVCRSGVALLYAHWEGFVKKSGSYFLEYVACKQCTISELKSNFVTLIVRSKINAASVSNKYSAFDDVTNYILTNQNARARIPTKNVIDTQSNLSTSVLKEILWCLGLEYDLFESKEKFIDVRLVSKRNHIAHGGASDVELDDFIEVIEEVISLMATFRNLLENSAILEQYKKQQYTKQ
jgi:hypothetical protein